ncbi:SusC/RagA family TonB-linked outer membrane protein [Portibacter lacus]|uniref:SusC/RagA family TonB-linked outer membrane protein n=1 Tax=Portibacter lacus TaxID=1099794 RepID=A0AA37WCD5_9BACT|nr:SusC/RagA family TonB-linked outer membrane protein [Portibacter lacus]GLR15973.1 SusC/RagA family TonB-linked outer membrane protein [Portibacter lacus]
MKHFFRQIKYQSLSQGNQLLSNFRLGTTIAYLLLGCLSLSAQQQNISGIVIDENNLPLPGANILIKGSNSGTQSDYEGKFSMTALKEDVIVVSFLGYITQELEIADRTVFNISMSPLANSLDEVVVTGYGSQSREKLTTSIAKMDTRILETSTRSNAATALQGTVPGLRVTNTTGQPGSTPQIVLRGGTNFSGGDSPLILIDGIPGSFYALNPDDIESIEVLKDAAATAIYGARSANGVILVTTKSGKLGKTNVNYKFRYSINNERNDQQYLEAADFITYNRQSVLYYNEASGRNNFDAGFLHGATGFATGGNTTNSPFTTQYLTPENEYLLSQPGWSTVQDPVDPTKEILFLNNPVNDNIYQDSRAKDHYVSFDGGNENGNYYLGLGYLDNDGLILGSGFERYSSKFSGSYYLRKNLKVNSNFLYAHSSLNTSPLGADNTVFRRFAGQPPTSRTYNNNPDGSLSTILNQGTNSGFGNPLYYKDKAIRNNLEQRLSASVGVDWEVIDNLTLSFQGSHFAINNHNESFNKAYLNGNTLITTRDASVSLARTLRNQLTATADYNIEIGNHNFNALVGSEYFKDNYFTSSAATRNSPTDLIETLNAGSEARGIPTSFETEYLILSTFGRLLYDYQNKYLVSLTFRNDGSSRLGNNKYDFFPGVSVGWNVHNEDFFANSGIANIISKFKPRVSYGVNGNVGVLSNYGVYGAYGSQGVYDGQTGYANTGLPVLDLQWERSTTLNAGFDLGLMKNRIGIIADFYTRDINDKLAQLTLPYYTGFSSITTNNGVLRNRGVEIGIDADVIRSENLQWNIGATFTQNKNYVVKLPENDNEFNRQGGTLIYNPDTGEEEWVGGLQEGQRYGGDLIITYVQDYIYQNQEQVDEHAEREDVLLPDHFTRYPGDVAWVDVNNDNVINSLDRQVIGRTTPSIVGGFTSNLMYKGFSLYVKADYAAGHMIYNHIRGKGWAQTQGNLNQPIEVLNSWTPENTYTDLPRYVFVDAQKNIFRGSESVVNSRFWEKGDYLALREVTLSYQFGSDVFRGVAKNLMVYATGSNLHYFKSYSGDTPEVGGWRAGDFPLPKTYTFGLNLNF